jgi:hypothetical protein
MAHSYLWLILIYGSFLFIAHSYLSLILIYRSFLFMENLNYHKMATPCIQCSKVDRTNRNRIVPLLTPITYDASSTIAKFSLPRKYTSTHDDETKEIFISVGATYNPILLASPEAQEVQSQVVGKWKKCDGEYQIRLRVLVSTEKNPFPFFRNLVFCSELGVVLEGIALAETALLKLYPRLGRAKIFVHFKSIDPQYDRVEYWDRLESWATPSCLPHTSTGPYQHRFGELKHAPTQIVPAEVSVPGQEVSVPGHEVSAPCQIGSQETQAVPKSSRKESKGFKKSKKTHTRREPLRCKSCQK